MMPDQDRKALNRPLPGPGGVKLLPAFDPFLLAHSKKHHLVEDRYYKRVYRSQGWISPVILLDGAVLGTWSHRIAGSRLTVEVAAFGKLAPSIRSGVESEAASLAKFFDKEVEIRWAA